MNTAATRDAEAAGKASLLVDSCTGIFLAAFDGGGNLLASLRRGGGERADRIPELAAGLLREAGLETAGLGQILAANGPGSFTGIRVGLAWALGLAFPRHLPLHIFSSLAAMRASAEGRAPRVGAAIPSRKGTWFVSKEAIVSKAASASRADAALPVESILSTGDLRAAAASLDLLVLSRPAEELAGCCPRVELLDELYAFERVRALALLLPPVPGGTVKPNYLLASAAEERAGG